MSRPECHGDPDRHVSLGYAGEMSGFTLNTFEIK